LLEEVYQKIPLKSRSLTAVNEAGLPHTHALPSSLNRVSGHFSFTDVDRDSKSLVCAGNHLLNPTLDPQIWKWPENPDEIISDQAPSPPTGWQAMRRNIVPFKQGKMLHLM
jgi:hypothetical protein